MYMFAILMDTWDGKRNGNKEITSWMSSSDSALQMLPVSVLRMFSDDILPLVELSVFLRSSAWLPSCQFCS